MQIRPIAAQNVRPITMSKIQTFQTNKEDSFMFENRFVDKKILVDRKIIQPQEDINAFFDRFSSFVFPNSANASSLSNLLKQGYVAFSTSTYADFNDPKSAIALTLDPSKSSASHCAKLEEYLSRGVGMGLNFSQFENPIEKLTYINKYFKYREPNLFRLPAGIALLNITHPKIMDFISLKDDADYKDWCFNNSVIMDKSFLEKVDNNEDLILDNGEKIPAKDVYNKLLDSMLKKGEPGIIFSSDKDFLCDCCAAAQLKENQGLNLAQINLSKFYDPKTNEIDYDYLSYSANILSLAMKNVAPDGYISVLGYQDLLNKMQLNYGSKKAIEILEKCLKLIKTQASANSLKMCISPSGATSRILKTTPSIEPCGNEKVTYWDELDTMKAAQKYLDGGISKTILLKKHHTIQDVDLIVRYANDNDLKGITVFPVQ